jgi:hypothetical protein
MKCNVDITDPAKGLSVTKEDECLTEMTWENFASCPICKYTDYDINLGECKNGKQTVSPIRARDCFGPQIRESTTQDCEESLAITTPVIVSVLGVFLVVLMVVVVLFIRNKKLAERYDQLVNESSRQSGA